MAAQRAGLAHGTYYAAELDKHAIQMTQDKHPETVQMGDVTKWREWNIDWASIGFVSAGFPCQSWSLAGKQLGDKDGRGMLFWVTLDIIANVLKHNPSAKFVMENVKMKKEFEEYITMHTEYALGEVHKTLINSALVSAQNRNRYYWTNFEVSQPEDKGIHLADVIESGAVDREKSYCIDANYFKGVSLKYYLTKKRRQIALKQGEQRLCVFEKDDERPVRKLTPLECERLQTLPDNYTLVQDDNGKQLVSNTQRYKAIGNGMTADVMAHIIKESLK
ncbi:MAG TPA: DNA cytosine methyltransferase [Pseudomonadales bacterium]|nr:DNA cytosine methyltransferase [Pseudomonadales bacterium]